MKYQVLGLVFHVNPLPSRGVTSNIKSYFLKKKKKKKKKKNNEKVFMNVVCCNCDWPF